MRLLNLSDQTKEYIKDGKLTQGHAKVIVGLEPKDEKTAVDTIIGQRLSVRETENLVKKLKDKNIPRVNIKIDEEYSEQLENLKNILNKFNIKTKINAKNVTLEFENASQIRSFIDKIN